MPQISPMNWMMIFMFLNYMILYMNKMFLYQKSCKSFNKMNLMYVK